MILDIVERLSASLSTIPRLTPQSIKEAMDGIRPCLSDTVPFLGDPGLFPYARKLLMKTPQLEVLIMHWLKRGECAPHDHGQSFGWIYLVSGQASHTVFSRPIDGPPRPPTRRTHTAGEYIFAPKHVIHQMGDVTPDDEPLVTLHIYAPPIHGMKVYDLTLCKACVVSDDCGAWWPAEQYQLVQELRLGNGFGRI